MKEAKVEDALVDGIHELEGECLKLIILGWIGAPDRLVLLPKGRIIFVELKRPDAKGKLRAGQPRFHKMLRRLGFRVEVLWTIEQVEDFLVTL